ncbi:MAG: hypothetical protein Q8R92_17380 [Deltaproteobacteria bacterium]|nr:hypothetical protein [Deltaproteobacteria bacterium]
MRDRNDMTRNSSVPALSTISVICGSQLLNSNGFNSSLKPIVENPMLEYVSNLVALKQDYSTLNFIATAFSPRLHQALMKPWKNDRDPSKEIPRLIAKRRCQEREAIIAGVLKGLKASAKSSDASRETLPKVSRFPTPPDSRWEHLTLRFLDGETVEVRIKDVRRILTHAEMGFSNARNGSPTLQWRLLEAFAEEEGELTWKSTHADRRNAKRKQLLARGLRTLFQIEGDPFQTFGKGWKARFRVCIDK